MGLQLTALGLHLPTLLGHSGATVAECAACGTRATKLHVTTATPKGKCIVDAINERLGARAAESTLNQQQHSGRPPRGGRVVGRLSAPRVPHHYRFAREHCPACTFGTPLGARQAVVFACHELSVRERCIKIVGSHELLG